MKKTKKQLLEERALKLKRRSEIKDAAGAEKRNLTAEEVTELEEIRSAVALIDTELDELEEQRAKDEAEARAKAANAKVISENEAPVSLTRLLRGIAFGDIDEASRAVFERGAEQLRASGVTEAKGYTIPLDMRSVLTTVEGAKTIQTEKKGLLDPLTQSLVFSRLGANISTGLKGNIEFVKIGGVQAQWKGETDKLDSVKPDFSTVEFKPRRLGVTVSISQLELIQDSLGVEQRILKLMNESIQNKLESTAFSTEALSSDAPKGLFNGTVTDKGAMSYDRAIGFISALDNNNALLGAPKFVTSPVGFSVCAKTPYSADKNLGYLSDYRDKNILGYEMLTTSAIPNTINTNESGLIFGNWADFFVGQWGGLSITVDNLTRAKEACVDFIINSYWDFGWLRDESRVIASIKAK